MEKRPSVDVAVVAVAVDDGAVVVEQDRLAVRSKGTGEDEDKAVEKAEAVGKIVIKLEEGRLEVVLRLVRALTLAQRNNE